MPGNQPAGPGSWAQIHLPLEPLRAIFQSGLVFAWRVVLWRTLWQGDAWTHKTHTTAPTLPNNLSFTPKNAILYFFPTSQTGFCTPLSLLGLHNRFCSLRHFVALFFSAVPSFWNWLCGRRFQWQTVSGFFPAPRIFHFSRLYHAVCSLGYNANLMTLLSCGNGT